MFTVLYSMFNIDIVRTLYYRESVEFNEIESTLFSTDMKYISIKYIDKYDKIKQQLFIIGSEGVFLLR